MFRQLADPAAPSFSIFIDGEEALARPGDTIAAVLLRTAPHIARHTPVKQTPRAPYCLMGVCFDCLATVDGETSVQTCLVEAQAGMRVERPAGKMKIAS